MRDLEQEVKDRDAELERVNQKLRDEIAERRRLEAELRRREEFLAEVQTLSRTRSWISPIPRAPEPSPESFEVVGLDHANPAPPVAWDWDVVHPDDRERVKQIVTEAIRARKGYEFEHRIVFPDGSIRIVHARGHPVADASGTVTEYIGTSTDVTRRRAAEAELRKQAELLSLSHEAVLVREPDGRISFWNRGAEETYGWTAQEVLGQLAHELLRTTFPDLPTEIETILRERGRWDGELVQVRRDGVPIVVASRWSQQRDDRGRPAAVLETNTDITARKRADEALQEAQARLAHVARVTTLGELTASIAHEVNQPLAAILNNANACLSLLANGDRAELDEVRAALADITVDADRASAVIERIRALARRAPPEPERLQLADVVADVVRLADRELKARGVAIRRDVVAALPIVLGDRVQLQQVLLNLLVNGMDAMAALEEDERVLEITECPEMLEGRPAATIRVRDRGVGLSSEDRLFEAFYTTKPNGMGMGLAISRSIIEAHGGRMWAEPNTGPGATFAFTLLAAEPDPR